MMERSTALSPGVVHALSFLYISLAQRRLVGVNFMTSSRWVLAGLMAPGGIKIQIHLMYIHPPVNLADDNSPVSN